MNSDEETYGKLPSPASCHHTQSLAIVGFFDESLIKNGKVSYLTGAKYVCIDKKNGVVGPTLSTGWTPSK